MFSRIFGKRDKSADAPNKVAQDKLGLSDAGDDTDSDLGTLNGVRPGKGTRLPNTTFANLGPVAQPASPPVRPVVAASVAPVAVHVAPVSKAPARPYTNFPADHQIDFVLPTAPMGLEPELSLEQRKTNALHIVEVHHQRIANTIRTLWGYRECSVYINRLIMAGGDGMGHARVGFNQDAAAAMLELSDVHDAEFGPPSTLGGALGLSI